MRQDCLKITYGACVISYDYECTWPPLGAQVLWAYGTCVDGKGHGSSIEYNDGIMAIMVYGHHRKTPITWGPPL